MDPLKPRNPWYVATLALASGSILIGGWLARPAEIPASPAPVPSESELQQLARRAERLTLESMTTYFAGIARQAEPSLVGIPSQGLSGIVWDARRIVTAPLAIADASARVPFATVAGAVEAEPIRWGPQMPLTVLEAPAGPPALTPAPRAESMPDAGEWVVAVWRTAAGRTFAVGNYRQSLAVTCGVTSADEIVSSVSLTPPMSGGGLFNMDGGLLGVILPCHERLVAMAASSVAAVLARDDSFDERLLRRYGLRVESLSTAEQEYFKVSAGLLVREVWTGLRGDAAGVTPGDIIVELNGHAVRSVDDLQMLASGPIAPVELTVHRGSKRLTVVLGAGPGAAGPARDPSRSGVMFGAAAPAFTIDSVPAGSRARLAGMQPGDHIVGINRAEPRSLRQVEALFAGDKPIWVDITRGDRRIGVLVR